MVQCYSVDAVLPIDARSYLVERDTAAFRSLLAKALNLGEFEIVDSWAEGPVKFVKFVTKPDFTAWVPKPALKALPSRDLAFYDTVTYDPKLLREPPFVLHVHTNIPLLGDKSNIQSTLTIDEEGPNATRQTLEGSIKIKVFGVGAVAERMVKGSLKRSYERLPEVVRRWVAFREKLLRQPGGSERLLLGRPSLSGVDWIREDVRQRLQAPYEAPDSRDQAVRQPSLLQRTVSFMRSSISLPPLPSCRQASATSEGVEAGLSEQSDASTGRRPSESRLRALLHRLSGRSSSISSSSAQQHRAPTPQDKQRRHRTPTPQDQRGRGAAGEPATLPRPLTPCLSAASGSETQRVPNPCLSAASIPGIQGASNPRPSAASCPETERMPAPSSSAASGTEPQRAPTPPSSAASDPGTQRLPTLFQSAASFFGPQGVPSIQPESLQQPVVLQAPSHETAMEEAPPHWSSFNRVHREWEQYWQGTGLPAIPGPVPWAGPLSPGLVRLGRISRCLALVRPASAGVSTSTAQGSTSSDGLAWDHSSHDGSTVAQHAQRGSAVGGPPYHFKFGLPQQDGLATAAGSACRRGLAPGKVAPGGPAPGEGAPAAERADPSAASGAACSAGVAVGPRGASSGEGKNRGGGKKKFRCWEKCMCLK